MRRSIRRESTEDDYPDDDTHVIHHRFTEAEIERRNEWQEVRRDLTRAVIRWLVLGFLGLLVYAGGLAILAWHTGLTK